jgi:catalase
MQAGAAAGGFVSVPERVEGAKRRARSETFFDHFSQARLFFRSQSDPEKEHIVQALRFELGKVERRAIRERMVGMLSYVEPELAARVASGLGIPVPVRLDGPLNQSIPADGNVAEHQPMEPPARTSDSPALSMVRTKIASVRTRRVAVLAGDGVDGDDVRAVREALTREGAKGLIVAPRLGELATASGSPLRADFSFATAGSSVLFDAVYVPGGDASVDALAREPRVPRFLEEAYGHAKAIGATGAGRRLLDVARLPGAGKDAAGVVLAERADAGFQRALLSAVAAHRHFEREERPTAG